MNFAVIPLLIAISALHFNTADGIVMMKIPAAFSNLSKSVHWSKRYTKTEYLEVEIDHFSFAVNKKFRLRYLINTHQWKKGQPIFFYTGNEDNIEYFAKNMGFLWDIAPEFKAMVVFAEHRYYGKSLPFGAQSLKNRHYFGYLTAEQALADYVQVITHIKSGIKGAESSPVITFGGSYGGMLAAWLRMKYPNIVAGAIASSAPVLMFPGVEPLGCSGFNMIMTHTFAVIGSTSCPSHILEAWKHIYNTTLGSLSKTFHLCKPLTKRELLVDWITNSLVKMTVVNYPYPTSYGVKLPAWPVKVFCNRLVKMSREKPLAVLSQSLQMIYNSTGKSRCLNISEFTTLSSELLSWEHQKCMEMVMPICSTGKNDMFLPSKWDMRTYKGRCRSRFGIEPRSDWMVKQFWGSQLKDASNILFSNGDLDPWAAVGVKSSQNGKGMPVILIRHAAHQLDLRGSNPKDLKSVKTARNEEKKWIRQWVKQWH